MMTSLPCDEGQHESCDGRGLVQGILRPPHEPTARGRLEWVTVRCECACHHGQPPERAPDLLDEQSARMAKSAISVLFPSHTP